MITEAIIHAITWHIAAVWVDVIKSLCELLETSTYGDIFRFSPGGKDYIYIWRTPLLSTLIAAAVTAACVCFTFLVYVIHFKCRTRRSVKHTARAKLDSVVRPSPVVCKHTVVSSHRRI